MNLIVPQMMQDVMTKAKTPQQAGPGRREEGQRPDRQAQVTQC